MPAWDPPNRASPRGLAALGVCATRTSAKEWPLPQCTGRTASPTSNHRQCARVRRRTARLKPSDGGETYETYSSFSLPLSLSLSHTPWLVRETEAGMATLLGKQHSSLHELTSMRSLPWE